MNTQYYGNTLLAWLIAGGLVVATVGILAAARAIALRRVKPLTSFRAFLLVAIRHTRYLFLLVIGMAVGSAAIELPATRSGLIRPAVAIIMLLQVAWWGHGIVGFWTRRVIRRRTATDLGSTTAIRTIGIAAKLAVWGVILLAAIAAMGFDVTALVAGLGIGGIAIALAVQNIIGDLFASVSIMVDKPFLVGDLIRVGEETGTVEEIGLKSTRVRSLSGEQIVFGNGDLLRSRIHNFRRMTERRVMFRIGVEYGTAPERVEAIPGMLRSAIEAQEFTRVDRIHFKEYGDSSLNFEAVYYISGAAFNLYMDIQQAVNLAIYRQFTDEGISFAFPTRTLILRSDSVDDSPPFQQ